MTKMTNKELFEKKALELIESFEELLDVCVPQKGDSLEECQKVCIVGALNDLQSCINGLERDDYVADEDWVAINTDCGFNFKGQPRRPFI